MLPVLTVLVLLLSGSSADDYTYLDTVRRWDPLDFWKAAADSENQTQCTMDFTTAWDDVMNKEMYALKMFDAWAKVPSGLLIGNHWFYGQYDECLSVVNPNETMYGRYCFTELLEPRLDTLPLTFTFGICIPDSCTAVDINGLFRDMDETNFSLFTNDLACNSYTDEVEVDAGAAVAMAVVALFILLGAVSTCYDLHQRFYLKNDKPHPLITSFSIYTNGKVLFEVKESTGQMDCLHGIRCFSMMWVVLCHVGAILVTGPVDNTLEVIQDLGTDQEYILTQNGYLSVDTFFFLSGLLVSFVFFRDIGSRKTYDAPRSFITRFVRLTPAYGIMIMIRVTLVRYLGDGPLWFGVMKGDNDNCRDYWWTGLLYVQNLVNPNNLCLVQTWYLSADMQMYWIAPIFLYIMLKWPIPGLGFTAFVCVAASFWTFGIALAYELPFMPMLDTTGHESRMDNYPFWSHMSPWLVGMILGSVICGLQARKVKVRMTWWMALCGWIASSAIQCSCLFGMIWFLDNPDHTNAQSAAFISFHRLGWAVGLAWVVFACIYGYGGPVNTLLSWGAFQPLGKLSYSMYLVHVPVISVYFGSSRTLVHTDVKEMWFIFFTIFLISNLLAIPLALLVEMPTGVFDRYFLRTMKVFPYPKPKPKREEKKLEELAKPKDDLPKEI